MYDSLRNATGSSVSFGGIKIGAIISIFSSSIIDRTISFNPCINPDPVTSRGLSGCANSGRSDFKRCMVFSCNDGSSIPYFSHKSAYRPPNPPEKVQIPRPFPSGSLHREKMAAVSASSSIVSTRMIPSCLKSPSTIVSLPARAPVWETAAFLAFAERPFFNKTGDYPGGFIADKVLHAIFSLKHCLIAGCHV